VRTPPLSHHTDIVIAGLAGAAVADNTHPLGRGAQTAHAWLDALHSRYLTSPVGCQVLSGVCVV
jgi:hypothetical protein